jgi:RecA/RadA recombinase
VAFDVTRLTGVASIISDALFIDAEVAFDVTRLTGVASIISDALFIDAEVAFDVTRLTGVASIISDALFIDAIDPKSGREFASSSVKCRAVEAATAAPAATGPLVTTHVTAAAPA